MLSSISQGGSAVRSFGYDAVGDQTSDVAGSTSMTRGFDGRSRLASIVSGSTTTGSYCYGGFDRLTQRVTPSATTRYDYDPLGHLVLETDQNDNSLGELTTIVFPHSAASMFV
jgi:YD repeat-containing protein